MAWSPHSRARVTATGTLVAWLWVMAGTALAAPSGGDGYVRTNYTWELTRQSIPYGYCDEHGCTEAVGEVQVDARVELVARTTQKIYVEIRVLKGPAVRATVDLYCHEGPPGGIGGGCGDSTGSRLCPGRGCPGSRGS